MNFGGSYEGGLNFVAKVEDAAVVGECAMKTNKNTITHRAPFGILRLALDTKLILVILLKQFGPRDGSLVVF